MTIPVNSCVQLIELNSTQAKVHLVTFVRGQTELTLKCTVNIILSDPSCKDCNAQLRTWLPGADTGGAAAGPLHPLTAQPPVFRIASQYHLRERKPCAKQKNIYLKKYLDILFRNKSRTPSLKSCIRPCLTLRINSIPYLYLFVALVMYIL